MEVAYQNYFLNIMSFLDVTDIQESSSVVCISDSFEHTHSRVAATTIKL